MSNENNSIAAITAPVTLDGVLQAKEPGVDQGTDEVLKFKRRMLEWANPVEFVNNMYGSHPDDRDNEYFKEVFGE